MIVVAADLARRRKDRGVLLNYPESVALITYEVMEVLGMAEAWQI